MSTTKVRKKNIVSRDRSVVGVAEKLKEYPLKNIKISMLKFDDSNPNRLTDEQMHGLRRSMERFGYLSPIVVDKDYLIADGEHRVQIYKEFGRNEIPAYVLSLSDEERRLIRQTMNKLRGVHDLIEDAKELEILAKADLLVDLSTLVAQDQKSLLKLIDEYHSSIDLEGSMNSGTEIPNDEIRQNKEFDSPISTTVKCPKCGYSW